MKKARRDEDSRSLFRLSPSGHTRRGRSSSAVLRHTQVQVSARPSHSSGVRVFLTKCAAIPRARTLSLWDVATPATPIGDWRERGPDASPQTRVTRRRLKASDERGTRTRRCSGRSDKAKLRRSTSSCARKIPDAKPQKAQSPRLVYSADGSRAFSMDQTIAPASSVTVTPSAKVSTFASPTADGSLMQIRGLRSPTGLRSKAHRSARTLTLASPAVRHIRTARARHGLKLGPLALRPLRVRCASPLQATTFACGRGTGGVLPPTPYTKPLATLARGRALGSWMRLLGQARA
jgi:hypothetical protein